VPQVSSTWLLAQDGQHTEPYMEIDSIEEIKDHYDDFNGKIIGIESDSGMMTIMREKLIPAYGLEDFELIPGTEVSMTAELANAIKKRKWIVVLGWTPHWKFGRWKLKFLEDPKNVWGSEESIHTLTRKGLKEDMPDVYKFLDNFNWSPEEMEQLLLWNEMGGNPYDNAKRWMRSNPQRVEAWLN
jgi:glycine betaine/proline transport system substrate-binding protein